MKRRFLALCLACIASTPAIGKDPDKVVSEYLRSEGGGTAVETKDGARVAYFGIVLATIKDLPENATLVAEFENPTDPAKPLKTILRPKAGEKKMVIRSEPFNCVVNHRYFNVTVTIFADAEQKQTLSRHVQPINVDVPQKTLRQLGLKEC